MKTKFKISDLKAYVKDNFYIILMRAADRLDESIIDYIDDFIDEYIELDESKDYSDCDFWNDQDESDNYFCDQVGHWADSQVEVIYASLWDRAKQLECYIEEAAANFGLPTGENEFDLMKLFQIGEYEFYSQVANEILNLCTEFFKQ